MFAYIDAIPNGQIMTFIKSDIEHAIPGYIELTELPVGILDPKGTCWYDFVLEVLVVIPESPGPGYEFNYDTKTWELVEGRIAKMQRLNTMARDNLELVEVNGFSFRNSNKLKDLLMFAMADNLASIQIYNSNNNPITLNKQAIRSLLKKITGVNYYNTQNFLRLLKLLEVATTQAQVDAINIDTGWYVE